MSERGGEKGKEDTDSRERKPAVQLKEKACFTCGIGILCFCQELRRSIFHFSGAEDSDASRLSTYCTVQEEFGRCFPSMILI